MLAEPTVNIAASFLFICYLSLKYPAITNLISTQKKRTHTEYSEHDAWYYVVIVKLVPPHYLWPQ